MSNLVQTTLDFTRGDKLGLLDDLCIPDAPGIKGATAKTVLRVIEGFGDRCYASAATMMTRTNLKLRTIKRALARLEQLDIVLTDARKRVNPSGVVTKSRLIDWTVIASRVDSQKRIASYPQSVPSVGASSQPRFDAASARIGNETQSAFDSEHGATVTAHGAMVSAHGAMVSKHGATVAPKPLEPQRTATNRPSNSAAAVSFDDWSHVEKRLRELKVHLPGLAIEAATASKLTQEAVLAICDEFELHRSRFSSPGAIVSRLRYGGWSVALPGSERVISESQKAKNDSRQRERIRFELSKEWRAIGRWPAPDTEVEAEIDRRMKT